MVLPRIALIIHLSLFVGIIKTELSLFKSCQGIKVEIPPQYFLRFALIAPFARQQRIKHFIDKTVMQPACFAENAFLSKSEFFGNFAALFVFDRAAHLDAVELQFVKAVINQRAAGFRNQSFALKRRSQPVADFKLPVAPIHIAEINLSGERAFVPDADGVAFAPRKPFEILPDPLACPFNRAFFFREPRRPFADMLEIFVDQPV
jgi:hypothetical protein